MSTTEEVQAEGSLFQSSLLITVWLLSLLCTFLTGTRHRVTCGNHQTLSTAERNKKKSLENEQN